MAEEFITPDFLQDADAEIIQARMMEALPADIDDMPGGFPWDFTMPTALVISEFAQYRLIRVMQAMFPQYAWGSWLDLHGARVNVIRRSARAATGTLTVTGAVGTVIPAGTVFCTPATDNSDSILYATDSAATIPSGGSVSIPITAVVPGSASNVMAGAISLAFKPIPALTSITNPAAITDGTDVEDDETYRERIVDYYRNTISFTGCPADYVRWAKEVSGVGNALCIPEWNGPGTVKLVIADAQGEPASQSILEAVRVHIMGPTDGSMLRLAPIGAALTVTAPEIVRLIISFDVKLKDGYDVDMVKESVQESLKKYWVEAVKNQEVHYGDVFSIINTAPGVYDCRNVRINGASNNVSVTLSQYIQTVMETVNVYA